MNEGMPVVGGRAKQNHLRTVLAVAVIAIVLYFVLGRGRDIDWGGDLGAPGSISEWFENFELPSIGSGGGGRHR